MCFVSLIVPLQPQAENKLSARIDKRVINKEILFSVPASQQTITKSPDFTSSHFLLHTLVIFLCSHFSSSFSPLLGRCFQYYLRAGQSSVGVFEGQQPNDLVQAAGRSLFMVLLAECCFVFVVGEGRPQLLLEQQEDDRYSLLSTGALPSPFSPALWSRRQVLKESKWSGKHMIKTWR